MLGLGLALAGVVAVTSSRLPFAPTPAECLMGRVTGGVAWLVGAAVAVVAGAAIAAMVRLHARTAAAGPFAAIVGIVLAAGLPLLAVGSCATVPVAATAGALALLSVSIALPWLRERGLGSLALGAALAATPHVAAVRIARLDAHAARPIGAVLHVARALPDDVAAVALLLASDLDEATAAALPVALWPRRVLAARADSIEAQWLLRMELPVLRCEPDRCTIVGLGATAPLGAGELIVTAAIARDQAGQVAGLSVRCERARIGHRAVVFAPSGTVQADFDDAGRAVFDSESCAQLRRWLRPVPSATTIRVLVVPPAAADVYGWTELRP